MGWEAHYTGIEILQTRAGPFRFYFQRGKSSKKLSFARVSAGRRSVGIFLRKLNYGSHFRYGKSGFEIFVGDVHFGVLPKRDPKSPPSYEPTRRYSGSTLDPWRSVTHRRGRLFLGWQQSQKAVDRCREEHERVMEEWFANYPDEDPGVCDDCLEYEDECECDFEKEDC